MTSYQRDEKIEAHFIQALKDIDDAIAGEIAKQVADVQGDITAQMTTACNTILLHYGLSITSEECDRMRATIRKYVTRSLEIENLILGGLRRIHTID